jgi:Trehalose utilisation
MSELSRRAFMASGVALAASSRMALKAASQTVATAEAPLRVQVMIGNGTDLEFLEMFRDFQDLSVRVTPSPGQYRYLIPDPAAAGRGGRGGQSAALEEGIRPQGNSPAQPAAGTGQAQAMPQGGFFRRTPDVIVLFDQIYDAAPEDEAGLQRYVEAGKGIVVLHNALTDFQRWPFWYRDVVGGAFLFPDSRMPATFLGEHEPGPAEEMLPDKRSTSPDKAVAPGVWDFVEYTVKAVRNHPITAGITSFTVRDERYKNVWQSPKITSVFETDEPTSDRVVGWIGPHPKAKVFAFMLGHSAEAHAHPVYRKVVHNAILWAGGRLA